jgi:methylenetetrahydrofolate--tRNA-(uracil-5-)-methyltransferase
MSHDLIVIGGGLAGSEAAWQAAEQGLRVELYEMRPQIQTGAHQGDSLAELVCSNSLGSQLPDRASGVLMTELRQLGSLLLSCAEKTAVPAGGALAVDREAFAQAVTERVQAHSNISIIREEVTTIPDGNVIIASGPLTSPALSKALADLTGEEHLYFFDALSPIVEAESIDMEIAFRASRYDRGEAEGGDYINCPLNQEEYEYFVSALLAAERIPLRSFEEAIQKGVRAGAHRYFEGCLPVEVIAERGAASLAFGPMRPVGLIDPRTKRRPHAVLQLRQDNLAGSLYNLVGFQTNLMYEEQRSVFRLIPGLQQARFVRFGQMHRNTFVNSPRFLEASLQVRMRKDLFLAGQITGVEGYLGNIATGSIVLPQTTMLGALCHYITHAEDKTFQPMKANFGILPPIITGAKRLNRRERQQAHAARSAEDLGRFMAEYEL